MSSKLFVGNLSYSTGEAELRRAFEALGTLRSVAIITDRMTGQHRGFGFVEYESSDDAQRAIASLDGQQVDGRTISVNVARERERTGGGGGGGYGGGGGGGFPPMPPPGMDTSGRPAEGRRARPAPGGGSGSDWDDKKKKKKARGGAEEPKKGERGGGGASWKNLGKDWDDDD